MSVPAPTHEPSSRTMNPSTHLFPGASSNHSPRLQMNNAIMCQADEILVTPLDKRALVNESRLLEVLPEFARSKVSPLFSGVRQTLLFKRGMSISGGTNCSCLFRWTTRNVAAICLQSSATSYVASNQRIRSIGRCQYHGMPLNTASTGDDKATVQ